MGGTGALGVAVLSSAALWNVTLGDTEVLSGRAGRTTRYVVG